MKGNMKWNNIHIIGIPEREEEEQGIENLFEKVANLMREKDTQICEGFHIFKRGPLQDTS